MELTFKKLVTGEWAIMLGDRVIQTVKTLDKMLNRFYELQDEFAEGISSITDADLSSLPTVIPVGKNEKTGTIIYQIQLV